MSYYDGGNDNSTDQDNFQVNRPHVNAALSWKLKTALQCNLMALKLLLCCPPPPLATDHTPSRSRLPPCQTPRLPPCKGQDKGTAKGKDKGNAANGQGENLENWGPWTPAGRGKGAKGDSGPQ